MQHLPAGRAYARPESAAARSPSARNTYSAATGNTEDIPGISMLFYSIFTWLKLIHLASQEKTAKWRHADSGRHS